MQSSTRELLVRFARSASLVEAVARPEDAGPPSEETPLGLPRIFLPPLLPLFPLLGQGAYLLVRGDGIHLDIVLVLDHTDDASAPFVADTATLQAAAAGCIALTGRLQGHPLPVKVLVLALENDGDVRERPGTAPAAGLSSTTSAAPGTEPRGLAAAARRLSSLRGSAGEHKVSVRAAAVDVRGGELWTNRRWPWPDELVRLLRETAAGAQLATHDEPPPGPEAIAPRESREARQPVAIPLQQRPFATLTLLGVLIGMFGAELVVDGTGALWAPKSSTLLALGGLSWGALARDHEIYRLLSCGFLHAGVLHLGLNGLALYLVGSFVERLAGPAWVLITFVLSLLGGSFVSLAVNRDHAFTVGASGAIMGLIAGGLMLTRRMPYGPHRTMARTRLWQWLIPALIPLTMHTGFGTIDVGAHAGGAVAGALLGAWLVRRWDPRQPWPARPLRRIERRLQAMAWLGCLLSVAALGAAVAASPRWLADAALAERLMPDAEAGKMAERINALLRGPRNQPDAAADGELARLRATYPDDPRVYYVSALWELQQGNDARGEELLRAGLRDTRVLTRAFPDRALEADMRRHLAEATLRRGDEAQARRDLAPVCDLPEAVAKDAFTKSLCAPR